MDGEFRTFELTCSSSQQTVNDMNYYRELMKQNKLRPRKKNKRDKVVYEEEM